MEHAENGKVEEGQDATSVSIKMETTSEASTAIIQETQPVKEEKKPIIPVSQPIQPRPKKQIDSCSLGEALDHVLHVENHRFTPLERR
jgi:hypothetical protein